MKKISIKYVFNMPYIICIAKYRFDNGVFTLRGKAKFNKETQSEYPYDEELGKNLAYNRAMMKVYRHQEKILRKNWNKAATAISKLETLIEPTVSKTAWEYYIEKPIYTERAACLDIFGTIGEAMKPNND